MTPLSTRAEQAAPDEALVINALRLLLNYVRQSRQGYVLAPLADRIAETTAEYALAVVEGPPSYATFLAGQLEQLKTASLAETERMNAAIAKAQEAGQ